MQSLCKTIVDSKLFQNAIIGLIIINAVSLGVETFQSIPPLYRGWLEYFNDVVLVVFVIEVALKLIAAWPQPANYFKDGWNVFDFSIVALSLLPVAGQFAMVARLLRLLRIIRLISTIPELRLIVSTLIRSLPSMGHILMLMSILFYIYAIAGFHLFHTHDATHWGNLGRALLSLFRIVTLEDWTDIMYTAMEFHPSAWLFFVSFVILGTFVVINLFIAVVINNLEQAKSAAAHNEPISNAELAEALETTRKSLERLQQRLETTERVS